MRIIVVISRIAKLEYGLMDGKFSFYVFSLLLIRWDMSSTGRATHDIVPTVGLQMKQSPDSRCVAISYNRLLLNDTSLRTHQHRMGLSDTNVCDCEQGMEDVHHFLFECTRYRAARKILLQTITSICDD